jgi:DNA repair exonuclease SbcCD ATPase subunit
MKLRAIKLTNIRRFAGRSARLSDIGDGITVLCEANEFGKSTFFDALHAVFFERHGSRNAVIKALQPHAGGAPEVAVEVDLPEGRFRIVKRWLQRPQAQVLDSSGRLVAQADEAEAWIDRIMNGGLQGPTGLLWVRQGLMGMETEGGGTDERRDRERGLAARRDLLSSVAGEIDMMTGGRRMDLVVDRVTAALAVLATDGGRPKANGEWKRALDQVEALALREADLRPRADRLSGDLARRSELQRTLARLTDPETVAERSRTLALAEAAHQDALAHQARIAQAETALRLADLDVQRAETAIAQLASLTSRLTETEAALGSSKDAATAAGHLADDLARRERLAIEAQEKTVATSRSLRLGLDRVNRARASTIAQRRAEDLQQRLDRAAEVQTELARARAGRGRIATTSEMIASADKAQAALDLAVARAEAQAVFIEARPEGQASQPILNGNPMPAGPQPLLAAAELILPGFGSLWIDPGSARASDSSAEILSSRNRLNALLAACGVESLTEVHALQARAREFDAAIAQSTALLAAIAPEGLDALRESLDGARAEGALGSIETDAGDPEILSAALAEAESAEAVAAATLRAAHDLVVEANLARAVADANRTSAERLFVAAQSEAGDPAALAERLVAHRESTPSLYTTRTAAESELAGLLASAVDLETTEARLARAKSASEQAANDISKTREDLAGLNERILALADEGLEEQLSALAEERAEAEARVTRYEAEVRSLTRLRRALEEARTRARDAYFGPVLRELQPLLHILHPGAQLVIDDTTLLPTTLTRNGQEEPLEILSGGTREQLAILTRLAFARLFAAAGRAVPVILDDALVHSDDDRIEAMFDALHRTSKDQQILVFTCRQRAFAALLGGERARVAVEAI